MPPPGRSDPLHLLRRDRVSPGGSDPSGAFPLESVSPRATSCLVASTSILACHVPLLWWARAYTLGIVGAGAASLYLPLARFAGLPARGNSQFSIPMYMRASFAEGRVRSVVLTLVIGSLGLNGCTCLTAGDAEFDVGMRQSGFASWYGEYFHGLTTANGETYDMHAMTAAHRTLPLGTVVQVTNIRNARQVVVRINDRGPYRKGRILDLSHEAARRLDMVRQGTAPVHVEVVGRHTLDRLDTGILIGRTFRLVEDQPFPGGVLREISGYTRLRFPPGDLLRAPRARSVADILEAEHHIYTSAVHLVLA